MSFTKKELVPGYVVKWRNGLWLMILPSNERGLVMVAPSHNWNSTDEYFDDLSCKSGNREFDVMEVYGLSLHTGDSFELSSRSRPLLWKREEKHKMTVSEICEALGYEVEIVKEKDEWD